MRLPGRPNGPRSRIVKIETVWKMAKKYAEDNNLEHNYAGVHGIAPL